MQPINPKRHAPKWLAGIALAIVVVLIAVFYRAKPADDGPFYTARIEAPNGHAFVAWFEATRPRRTADEETEFNQAIGIIYAECGAKERLTPLTAGPAITALCKRIDGQVAGDMVIYSYQLADEKLLMFISRQQNDITKIIAAMGTNATTKAKQQLIDNAYAQIAKNQQRIAAIRDAGKW